MKRFHTFALIAALTLTAGHAQAQLRVDARLHSSGGSCAQCDLSNKRMNGMTLKNANFAGSRFNNSNLSGGQIDGSDLTGAHFKNALLYRIEGRGVKMANAVMSDATLTEARLESAVMRGVDLQRANLTRSSFIGSDFASANLSNSRAKGGNFQDSDFNGATLDDMDLQAANLDGAKLHGAHFGEAILLDTSMSGADISGADLSTAQGIKQAQLDTACGDSATRLPLGLFVAYCNETEVLSGHNHGPVDPEMEMAALRLDRAIGEVETLLAVTPPSNRTMRRSLQRIHSDLSQSRRAIEK